MSEAVLRVNHLSIGYGSRCVISDASFTIGKGELVGIIGCNGLKQEYAFENNPRYAAEAER